MIQSKPFYWVTCDQCGARHPADDEGIAAWSDAGDALDSAQGEDWEIQDDKHLCYGCAMAAAQPQGDGQRGGG